MPLKGQQFCPIKFTAINAQINFEHKNLLVLAQFSPTYFYDQFENEKDEFFLATADLAKVIHQTFPRRHCESIFFKTEKNLAHIVGDDNSQISVPLTPVPENLRTSQYQPKMTEYGLMPEKDGKTPFFNVHARVPTEQFQRGFPKKATESDIIMLGFDGNNIYCGISTGGINNTFQVRVEEFAVQREPIAVYFNKKEFMDFIKSFYGEVWFGIGKSGVIVSETNSEWKRTCLLKAEKVEEEL